MLVTKFVTKGKEAEKVNLEVAINTSLNFEKNGEKGVKQQDTAHKQFARELISNLDTMHAHSKGARFTVSFEGSDGKSHKFNLDTMPDTTTKESGKTNRNFVLHSWEKDEKTKNSVDSIFINGRGGKGDSKEFFEMDDSRSGFKLADIKVGEKNNLGIRVFVDKVDSKILDTFGESNKIVISKESVTAYQPKAKDIDEVKIGAAKQEGPKNDGPDMA